MYDAAGHILRMGDGGRRDVTRQSPTVASVAAFSPNTFPKDVAVAPDGTLYVTIENRIMRIKPDGSTQIIAGTASSGCGADDSSNASAIALNLPWGIDIGPDGAIYIADGQNHKVRKIIPGESQSSITTIVGRGSCTGGFAGDGGQAGDGRLSQPRELALGPDGSIYIVDSLNLRIRRVSPDNIIRTVAGNGVEGEPQAGGLATASRLPGFFGVVSIDVSPHGEVHFVTNRGGAGAIGDARILKIDSSGVLRTVAGTPGDACADPCNRPDGVLATQTPLLFPTSLSIGPDGSMYLTEKNTANGGVAFVSRIGPDGRIGRLAGQLQAGFGGGDGGPARLATFADLRGTDPGPDGSLFVADGGSNGVRKVIQAAQGLSSLGYKVASEDGREVYEFGPNGQHERTRDALTNGIIFEFGYDPHDRLASITDGGGKVTTIEGPRSFRTIPRVSLAVQSGPVGREDVP